MTLPVMTPVSAVMVKPLLLPCWAVSGHDCQAKVDCRARSLWVGCGQGNDIVADILLCRIPDKRMGVRVKTHPLRQTVLAGFCGTERQHISIWVLENMGHRNHIFKKTSNMGRLSFDGVTLRGLVGLLAPLEGT